MWVCRILTIDAEPKEMGRLSCVDLSCLIVLVASQVRL